MSSLFCSLLTFWKSDCLGDHLQQSKVKHSNFRNEYSLFFFIYEETFRFLLCYDCFNISLLHIHLSTKKHWHVTFHFHNLAFFWPLRSQSQKFKKAFACYFTFSHSCLLLKVHWCRFENLPICSCSNEKDTLKNLLS